MMSARETDGQLLLLLLHFSFEAKNGALFSTKRPLFSTLSPLDLPVKTVRRGSPLAKTFDLLRNSQATHLASFGRRVARGGKAEGEKGASESQAAAD